MRYMSNQSYFGNDLKIGRYFERGIHPAVRVQDPTIHAATTLGLSKYYKSWGKCCCCIFLPIIRVPTTSQLIGSPKNCFVPESRLHASRIVVVAFRNYDDYGGDDGFYITIKKMRRRERRSDEVNEDEDICSPCRTTWTSNCRLRSDSPGLCS